jgi:chromosome partitioning protein
MIVLIGSQKGGCGKSTIAINIAAYLAKHNKDIVLVDADPQQSSANWVKDAMKPVYPKYIVFNAMAILRIH